jgi:hypothetical protein
VRVHDAASGAETVTRVEATPVLGLVVRRVDVGRVEPADALEQRLYETASPIGGDGISTQSCSVMGFLVTPDAADEFVAPGQSKLVTP